ncbi:hypothetical protein J1C67_14485 [Clostridium gasigenes]|uniref:BRO-N domain-containing protein n=1 Tax=Clostridium gasigenes TaxID=94869 RepID=UPI00143834B0|nr:BRO family protein [Clostridium gasigenes]NKF05290.1 hypothetical protein [Clostridium gasigenes]QSW18745.1 hypothetical protein J1C67_14485 [Clostridium gasigenes]
MDNLTVLEQREVLGKEFTIYGTKDEPLFLAKDVADWIEHTHVTKMLKNIDEDEKTTCTINTCGNYKSQATFLTEDGFYEVLMTSRKPIAKVFKKEVKVILKEIRTNGAYVSQNITPEQEVKLDLFSTPLKRRNTFENTPIESLEEVIGECMDYNKRKTAKDKIIILKHAMKVIEERKELSTSAGLSFMLADILTNLSKTITATSNRKNGCIVRSKNKELIAKDTFIGKCKEYVDECEEFISYYHPTPEEYTTLYYHGFTVNYAYKAKWDSIICSNEYRSWKDNFPVEDIPDLSHIDFTKKVNIWMYFDHKEKMDVPNFSKSLIDAICSHIGVNDNKVQLQQCVSNEYINRFSDGKTYFVMKQA